MRTCVTSDGRFRVGIHRPGFTAANLRRNDYPHHLGTLPDGTPVDNRANFPHADVHEPGAGIIYEIHNPFGFRGTTFINSAWADRAAADPGGITIPSLPDGSVLAVLAGWAGPGADQKKIETMYRALPRPVLLAVAGTSSDPEELAILSRMACEIQYDTGGRITGLAFSQMPAGHPAAVIYDHLLFETVVNNPALPDEYKHAMVLKPGIQGTNEIVAEWKPDNGSGHVFEYLRRNSYIPWGHYAANMADDSVRYRIRDLSLDDMTGMRHLYYQRIFIRLAQALNIPGSRPRRDMDAGALEVLRKTVLARIRDLPPGTLEFNCALWGWNFGFQQAHNGYRLHASHQQVHQQNAMIPGRVPDNFGQAMDTFACGDLIEAFINDYRRQTGVSFFACYLDAVRRNDRTDGDRNGPSDLVVFEDDYCLLFVPKAQVAQWELQLIPKYPVGNILEADRPVRQSLDAGILLALSALENLGARMVTSVEFSKRFDSGTADQHLVYSFLPRLPHAPDTFSEAQFRWISGSYPEDFAAACRRALGR